MDCPAYQQQGIVAIVDSVGTFPGNAMC